MKGIKNTDHQLVNKKIDDVARRRMVTKAYTEAAEKSLEAALLSGDKKAVEVESQKCRDHYDTFVDAIVNQYITVMKIHGKW